MAEIKWIKLTTDMFDNRKIRHLRKLPEGNSIVLIWVMLLTLAGKCNAGGMIFLTENIPYTPKMLADELGFEESLVRLALEALERFGMISTDEAAFCISGWEEYQNIEGMEKIREQNRIRKAKQRESQKLLVDETMSRDMSRDVTQQNKNKNKNKNKIENNKKEYIVGQNPTTQTDSDEIIAFLNEKAGTNYKPNTKKTKTCINARMQEGFTIDDFKTVIEKKCAEWIGTEWEKFLRPETLFGTKFEGYLNAKTKAKSKPIMQNQNDLDDIF